MEFKPIKFWDINAKKARKRTRNNYRVQLIAILLIYSQLLAFNTHIYKWIISNQQRKKVRNRLRGSTWA